MGEDEAVRRVAIEDPNASAFAKLYRSPPWRTLPSASGLQQLVWGGRHCTPRADGGFTTEPCTP